MSKKKIKCYAQTIEDYNFGQQIPKSVFNPADIKHMVNPYSNSIYLGNRKLPGAAYTKDIRRYHHWINLDELKTGGVAQCGIPVKSRYRDDVVNGIHYYRDTGAIAGCSGTYCKPATLRLSNFNFAEKGLNKNCKIEEVKIILEHRRTAVCTPTNGTPPYECVSPQLNKTLGLSMDGLNIYPQYTTLKFWLANGNNAIVSKYGEGKKRFENPPHKIDNQTKQPIWQTIGETYTASVNPQLTIDNILKNDFCLYLDYGANLMGDRGILYLKNVYIEITYEEGKPFIECIQEEDTVVSSKNSRCRKKITHHILSGFRNSEGFPISPEKPFNELSTKEQDEQYCLQHVRVNESTIPNGVIVTEKSRSGNVVVYEIEDTSDEEGDKLIQYYLDNHLISTTGRLTTELTKIPEISCSDFLKKGEPYKEGTHYIDILGGKNVCLDRVDVYFDSLDSTPLVFDIHCLKQEGVNLLYYNSNCERDDTYVRQFFNKAQTLDCGVHKVYLVLKSASQPDLTFHKNIKILPQEYSFSIYDSNNPSLTYVQDKDNPYQTITIKRIDSEPAETVDIVINDPTQLDKDKTIIRNVRKGVEYSYNISKRYSGKFRINVKPVPNNCSIGSTSQLIKITVGNHKQYHDTLFVRGEDSTSFDYDYLVAWEGDNIKTPIKFDSIEKGHDFEDILLCSNKIAYAGLSQTKTIPLTVKNIGDNGTIKNCQIELNALDLLEDGTTEVSTQEWTSSNGIFYNFYNKFYKYNKDIADQVEIRNIDANNNLNHDLTLTGEENVYILIKELPEEESITIQIPFENKNPVVKCLEYRIFQEVIGFNTMGCDYISSNQSDKVTIYVYDSILTDLSITGKTDILNPYTTIDDCPNVCYNTDHEIMGEPDGITYRITNIDSSNYENTGIKSSNIAPTLIENSIEMVPYAYKLKGQLKQELNDESDIANKLSFDRSITEKQINLNSQLINAHIQFPSDSMETIIKQRTDKYGETIFNIQIPSNENRNYTIEELLSDIVYIEYPGNIDYLPSAIEMGNLTKLNTKVTPIGILYEDNIIPISNNTKIPVGVEIRLLYKLEYEKDSKWNLLNDKTVFLYNDNNKKQILITNEKDEYNISAKIINEYNLSPNQILNKYDIVFKGDSIYHEYNIKNIPIDDYRDVTQMTFIDNWKIYKPGQVAQIKIKLVGRSEVVKNDIIFNAEISDPYTYDEVTIYYKMCNLQEYQCNIAKIDNNKARLCQRNKGIFLTSFSTNDYRLVENKVSEEIYCGIDNDINLVTKLEKKTIQSGDINVIYMNLYNNIKNSKDVKVHIDLGRNINPSPNEGDYTYINIDNTDGDFSYSIKDDRTILIWAIGDMLANTQTRAIIKIKANRIGLSNIKIDVEDYNHRIGTLTNNVGNNPCEDWECPNQ